MRQCLLLRPNVNVSCFALTIPLNGRATLTDFRTGPRTQCHGAHGAATMNLGPFQRFVRFHPFDSRSVTSLGTTTNRALVPGTEYAREDCFPRLTSIDIW